MVTKLYKIALWIQGSYTLATALWAIIDIDSFMAVTGPKTDIWLVKTVSVVLLAVGLSFLTQALTKGLSRSVAVLALVSSAGLAFIDIYYSAHEVISQVYLADAALQLLFGLTWTYLLLKSTAANFE